jgi:hypothetical protein
VKKYWSIFVSATIFVAVLAMVSFYGIELARLDIFGVKVVAAVENKITATDYRCAKGLRGIGCKIGLTEGRKTTRYTYYLYVNGKRVTLQSRKHYQIGESVPIIFIESDPNSSKFASRSGKGSPWLMAVLFLACLMFSYSNLRHDVQAFRKQNAA